MMNRRSDDWEEPSSRERTGNRVNEVKWPTDWSNWRLLKDFNTRNSRVTRETTKKHVQYTDDARPRKVLAFFLHHLPFLFLRVSLNPHLLSSSPCFVFCIYNHILYFSSHKSATALLVNRSIQPRWYFAKARTKLHTPLSSSCITYYDTHHPNFHNVATNYQPRDNL